MKALNDKINTRIELKEDKNGDLEIRYYDTPECPLCMNWKMPKYIVKELVEFWKKINKNKGINFPVNERRKRSEFTMHTHKYVDIREIDNLGHYKIIGWSLPNKIVDKLVIWQKDKY